MATSSEQRFRAVLESADRGGGHWVEVPFDPRAVFGQARAAVEGTVNGTPVRSRLALYGGRAYLGLTRAVRTTAGIEAGDEIEVVLRRDDAPREVEIPPELGRALAGAPDVREYFDGLAFTHRREYAQWVAEAKRAETRASRAERAVARLREEMRDR